MSAFRIHATLLHLPILLGLAATLTAPRPAAASGGDTARSAEPRLARRAPAPQRLPSRAVQARRLRMSRALATRAAARALPAGRGDAYLLYAEEFRIADSAVRHVPPSATTSIDSLGAHFRATLPSEAARARAVYRWVTENIAYDVDAFYGNRLMIPVQSAWAVFERRRAVCEGFAYLTNLLGHAAGIETRVVEGHAKAFSGNPRDPIRVQKHAWNAMRVEGRWWLLDASWGAGDLVDRRFVRNVRDTYFAVPPERMVFTHRADEVQWQLLDEPLTLGDYGRLVTIPRDFWSLGFDPEAVRLASARGLRGGLVSTFGLPSRPLRIHEAPLDAVLEPGSTHHFRLDAPNGTEAFAISGTRWYPLAKEGSTFAGEGSLQGEGLVVLVRYPDRPDGMVVLEYRAPGPAAGRGGR